MARNGPFARRFGRHPRPARRRFWRMGRLGPGAVVAALVGVALAPAAPSYEPAAQSSSAAKVVLYKAKLPKGFPKWVPLPTGSRVLASEATSAPGGTSFGVDFGVEGSVASVAKAYDTRLKKAGLSPGAPAKVPGGLSFSGYNAKYFVNVEVTTRAPDDAGGGESLRHGEAGLNLSVAPA